jgi:hypothetical protein
MCSEWYIGCAQGGGDCAQGGCMGCAQGCGTGLCSREVHRLCSGKWVWTAVDSMCQPLDSCV